MVSTEAFAQVQAALSRATRYTQLEAQACGSGAALRIRSHRHLACAGQTPASASFLALTRLCDLMRPAAGKPVPRQTLRRAKGPGGLIGTEPHGIHRSLCAGGGCVQPRDTLRAAGGHELQTRGSGGRPRSTARCATRSSVNHAKATQ